MARCYLLTATLISTLLLAGAAIVLGRSVLCEKNRLRQVVVVLPVAVFLEVFVVAALGMLTLRFMANGRSVLNRQKGLRS